jgi:hypothetical protein
MKTLHLSIIFAIISVLNAYAQSPIYPKYENSTYGREQGAYYKDINNVHNQYVGTWLYTSGNTSLKIVFRKRTMVLQPSYDNSYYTDFLVGEYQYIENGVEKINTLSNLYEEYSDSWDYNICARFLRHKSAHPKCVECITGEKTLGLIFNEPSRRHLEGERYEFAIRRFTENNQTKLKVWFIATGNGLVTNRITNEQTNITNFTLPFGEYVLIKQL